MDYKVMCNLLGAYFELSKKNKLSELYDSIYRSHSFEVDEKEKKNIEKAVIGNAAVLMFDGFNEYNRDGRDHCKIDWSTIFDVIPGIQIMNIIYNNRSSLCYPIGGSTPFGYRMPDRSGEYCFDCQPYFIGSDACVKFIVNGNKYELLFSVGNVKIKETYSGKREPDYMWKQIEYQYKKRNEFVFTDTLYNSQREFFICGDPRSKEFKQKVRQAKLSQRDACLHNFQEEFTTCIIFSMEN